MHYDNCGVPILTDIEVEDIAYKTISEFDESLLSTPCVMPIMSFFENFKKKTGLQLFYEDLGVKGVYKIRGRIIFSKKAIYLDKELSINTPIFLFTMAHELGHWILHSGKKIKFESSKKKEDDLEDYDINYYKKELHTPRDWMEHQANVFAASFLMPRDLIKKAVIEKQFKMGITRNLGTILLSAQEYSEREYKKISVHLQSIFGTSEKSIEVRLKYLGILVEDKNRRANYISEIYKI